MAEPTSTVVAAATIAAAATTIPVLTILGVPLGVRPEILIAGFFGGLVGIALLNTVPAPMGGAWTAILTAANWRRIGNRQRAASAAWVQSPYAWRDAWVAGTYAANDIVFVPSISGATVLKPRDPSLNASRYLSVPVYLRHGTGDTLVPSSQATNFQTAVNALGGNVTVDFIAGAGHIAPACYSRTAEVAFIESCR